MPGISVSLKINDIGLQQRLSQLKENFSAGSIQQALVNCGVQAQRSTQLTFAAEGRPTKWPALAPATVRHKKKTGHTKMLVDSSILKNSIVPVVEGNKMIIGTAVPYARIHQLGGEIHHTARKQVNAFNKKGKFLSHAKAANRKTPVKVHVSSIGAHDIKIPARPFLLFQPGDIDIFKKIFRDTLLKK